MSTTNRFDVDTEPYYDDYVDEPAGEQYFINQDTCDMCSRKHDLCSLKFIGLSLMYGQDDPLPRTPTVTLRRIPFGWNGLPMWILPPIFEYEASCFDGILCAFCFNLAGFDDVAEE